MSQYLLMFEGAERPPKQEMDKIRALPGLVILDERAQKFFLVDYPNREIVDIIQSFKDWAISEQQTYRIPNIYPGVKRPLIRTGMG